MNYLWFFGLINYLIFQDRNETNQSTNNIPITPQTHLSSQNQPSPTILLNTGYSQFTLNQLKLLMSDNNLPLGRHYTKEKLIIKLQNNNLV